MSTYSIVQIPGWENLSLHMRDSRDLDRRIGELAHGTVPASVPRDTATPFRQEVKKELTRLVDQARAAGAGLLSLPTQRVGGCAVPASYTVSEWRDTEPGDPGAAAVLDALVDSRRAAGVANVAIVDVDGQPALREEEIEPADPDADHLATHPGRRVTYTVASPEDARAWVVFTFVTLGDGDPQGKLADILVEVFDAHVSTLRWGARRG